MHYCIHIMYFDLTMFTVQKSSELHSRSDIKSNVVNANKIHVSNKIINIYKHILNYE